MRNSLIMLKSPKWSGQIIDDRTKFSAVIPSSISVNTRDQLLFLSSKNYASMSIDASIDLDADYIVPTNKVVDFFKWLGSLTIDDLAQGLLATVVGCSIALDSCEMDKPCDKEKQDYGVSSFYDINANGSGAMQGSSCPDFKY